MYHYFNFRKQEFLKHYRQRSNIKSTFSMMKRKFGHSLRSKTDTAMVNETCAKLSVITLSYSFTKCANSELIQCSGRVQQQTYKSISLANGDSPCNRVPFQDSAVVAFYSDRQGRRPCFQYGELICWEQFRNTKSPFSRL